MSSQVQSIPAQVEETLEQKIARLEQENAKLKAKATPGCKTANGLSLKVSEKGAVAIYGLGRFPVVLYKSQMERVLGCSEEIKAFIAANEAKLTVKAKPDATDDVKIA